jgi:hypothetical protein
LVERASKILFIKTKEKTMSKMDPNGYPYFPVKIFYFFFEKIEEIHEPSW